MGKVPSVRLHLVLLLTLLATTSLIGADAPRHPGCAPDPIAATPAEAFGSDVAADLGIRLTWLPDDSTADRPIDPGARARVADDYLRAWQEWNRSYRCDSSGLEHAFRAPALDGVRSAVADAGRRGWQVA